MKRLALSCVLAALLTLVPTLSEAKAETQGIDYRLKIEIKAQADSIRVGEELRFTATLTNGGHDPVTLVQPGEGSRCKWRTPVVGWSILTADDKGNNHPAEPPLGARLKCKTINPIQESEVFLLTPGTSQRLNASIGSPTFPKPGKFKVALMYQNIPDLEGLASAKPEVREKVQRSHRCLLVSNEVFVEVLPSKKVAELFSEEHRKTVPDELVQAYVRFVDATKRDDVASSCLPHAVTLSHEPRAKGKQEYGQEMNLPFLKQGFSPKVQVVRKDPDDTYLIRTATTAMWFVQTKSGAWKIYRYFDKPIE